VSRRSQARVNAEWALRNPVTYLKVAYCGIIAGECETLGRFNSGNCCKFIHRRYNGKIIDSGHGGETPSWLESRGT